MKSVTARVGKAFIERRDYLANDRFNSAQRGNRSLEQVMINCDCEFAEHHISSLNLGHELIEAYEYDTVHDEYGKCEWKHAPKTGRVYISKWCQNQDFDTFVFWNFLDRDWSRPLNAEDVVTYQIIEYKPKDEVVNNIKRETYYEYLHPQQ
jgi:hypothetical protein